MSPLFENETELLLFRFIIIDRSWHCRRQFDLIDDFKLQSNQLFAFFVRFKGFHAYGDNFSRVAN